MLRLCDVGLLFQQRLLHPLTICAQGTAVALLCMVITGSLNLRAAVAQWIERFPPEEEAVGSNPTSRATFGIC